MIIAPLFGNDTNKNLMCLQHEMYSDVSILIVSKAREIYLAAGKIFDPFDPRYKIVEEKITFEDEFPTSIVEEFAKSPFDVELIAAI